MATIEIGVWFPRLCGGATWQASRVVECVGGFKIENDTENDYGNCAEAQVRADELNAPPKPWEARTGDHGAPYLFKYGSTKEENLAAAARLNREERKVEPWRVEASGAHYGLKNGDVWLTGGAGYRMEFSHETARAICDQLNAAQGLTT